MVTFKNCVLGAFLPFSLAACAPAGTIPGLNPTALAVMQSEPYENGLWSIKVVDEKTGEVLVAHNEQVLMEPASVTKTFSTGAAWIAFGADSKIATPVVHTGTIAGGTLTGDLILVAKGDVTMGGQTGADGKVVFTDLDHNDANLLPGATIADNDPLAGLDVLARQVKAAGVSTVAGQVIVDDRLFETETLGLNDGPVSPIVINNNLIDLVTTPTQPGADAMVRMRPVVAPWTVTNKVKTVAAGEASQIRVKSDQWGSITLEGTIAVGSKPDLKVWHFHDPPRFARTAFIEALARAGVTVAANATAENPAGSLPSETAVAQLPKVAELEGLPMSEQGKYILKVSYNRGGQTMVCLLAAAKGSKRCEDGFPEVLRHLATIGMDPHGTSLVDGSGLPGNYVTATAITELMLGFAKRPDFETWKLALPIMGVDGSIAEVQKGASAAGKVFAKTGTLGAGDLGNGRLRLETKALGGYIEAKSGRRLGLALMVNQAMFDDLAGVFAANEDLGKIATSLYEQF